MVVAQHQIKNGKITHISLCRRAMNHLPVLMKSSGRMQVEMLTKAGKEGLVYALVYVPDAPDQEGHMASAAEIRKMAHDFLANAAEANGGIDIEHNFKVLGQDQVRIAETFIVQKGDPRFEGWKDHSGNQINPEGSWGVVLKVLDPTLRAEFENGNLNGVSMFGHAELVPIGKSTTEPNNQPQQQTPMTPQETSALAVEIVKALQASGALPQPQQVQKAQKIEFEGDPTNEDDLRAHEDKVFQASLDLSNAGDIAKLRKHNAKRKAEADAAAKLAKSGKKEFDAETASEDELRAELKRLQKSSGAPEAGDGQDGDDSKPSGNTTLAKSEAKAMQNGRSAMRKAMAKLGVPCVGGKPK